MSPEKIVKRANKERYDLFERTQKTEISGSKALRRKKKDAETSSHLLFYRSALRFFLCVLTFFILFFAGFAVILLRLFF
jgi:hypothetical protein